MGTGDCAPCLFLFFFVSFFLQETSSAFAVFLSFCLTVGMNERMTGRKRERKMEREKEKAVSYIHKLVLVS